MDKAVGIYYNLLTIWEYFLKITILFKKRRKMRRRRWWVKPHISLHMRDNYGGHAKLFRYFKLSDHEEFFKFTRMLVEQFNILHDLLKPKKVAKEKSQRAFINRNSCCCDIKVCTENHNLL